MRALLLLVFLSLATLSAQAPRTTKYTLPPDKLEKAIDYAHARNILYFGSQIYGVAILAAIIALGVAAKFRDWAVAASRRRFLQALIVVPLLLLTIDLANLPLALYSQHLERKFAQSIQTWPSWFWDWTKAELLSLILLTLVAFLLNAVMRRSPRRWWFYFWLATIPITFAIAFVEPFLIEPLFYHFEPLSQRHPDLVNDLEKVVAHGGLAIPPDRMFEMTASEKVTSMNAYVSGFGASKRVVVWDTTIQKLTTPEILSVFGHEMGHYVLGHVRNSILLGSLFSLVLLYAGYRLARWRIRDLTDWASLPALLLIATLFAFFSEPIVNGYSRWQEHQADVYGLEIIRGIVPDPAQVTAHTFQVMGEDGLDEPDPNRFLVFWTYSHPSISDRVAFASGRQ
ncbi:MAG TPA: M48 family metallopeptidase [Bryobacteraceae bacterium]|nr:M48 family metallopeptidase [Bryobacteraceae bacterium]